METKRISGSSRTVVAEVDGRDYDVIILLVGVNDLTYGNSAWKEMYRRVVRNVKNRAPEAKLFIHSIMPINNARARANGYYDTMHVAGERQKRRAAGACERGEGRLPERDAGPCDRERAASLWGGFRRDPFRPNLLQYLAELGEKRDRLTVEAERTGSERETERIKGKKDA